MNKNFTKLLTLFTLLCSVGSFDQLKAPADDSGGGDVPQSQWSGHPDDHKRVMTCKACGATLNWHGSPEGFSMFCDNDRCKDETADNAENNRCKKQSNHTSSSQDVAHVFTWARGQGGHPGEEPGEHGGHGPGHEGEGHEGEGNPPDGQMPPPPQGEGGQPGPDGPSQGATTDQSGQEAPPATDGSSGVASSGSSQ